MTNIQKELAPYKTIIELFNNVENPLSYNFSFENEGSNDRCRLARDFYLNIFEIKITKLGHDKYRFWSCDTINSFQTLFNKAFCLHCKESRPTGRQKVSRKWLKNNQDELAKQPNYISLINNPYIIHFRHWTHTIGNFILIPFYTRFDQGAIVPLNNYKGIKNEISDFFDLDYTIKCIKNGLQLNSIIAKEYGLIFDINDYFSKFYLTSKNSYKGYVSPVNWNAIPLFKRESVSPLPNNESELKECMLAMIDRIINRGLLIAEKQLKSDKHRFDKIRNDSQLLLTKYELCSRCTCKLSQCHTNNNCALKQSIGFSSIICKSIVF